MIEFEQIMLRVIILLFTLIALGSATFENTEITKKDIADIRVVIQELIEADENKVNGVRILIPGMIRLIFHDCIGKCDGCINKDLVSSC